MKCWSRVSLKSDDSATKSHRAFFMVFSPMLESPDWPSAYEVYRGGLVVMNPYNSTKATVQKVKDDLDVKVVMYWDSQDIQIRAKGKCLSSKPSKICSDNSTDWTQCASGAMPCCFSYECNACECCTHTRVLCSLSVLLFSLFCNFTCMSSNQIHSCRQDYDVSRG
jgi:hypothetical protein